MRLGKYLCALTVMAGLLSTSCVKEDEDSNVRNYVNPGDALPDFGTLRGPYGSFSSDDFIGKKGMLVFFASYCPDCTGLMPAIQQVWDELGGDPRYIIAPVSRQGSGETENTVAVYWDEQQFTMPYYIDTGRWVFDMFANLSIPRVYITDTEGIIRWMSHGTSNHTARQLIDLIQAQK